MSEVAGNGRINMAVDVTTSLIIDRPRHLVASFAANPDNVPVWYVNIKSVEWKTTIGVLGADDGLHVLHDPAGK